MIGKTLGHYEIVSPLGAGGMGEVYRARDTRLQRDVAIKVVPEALAADPERFARLEREAHALAALNHPNIATIHGLEQEGPLRYLVLELVEGETLEERLRGGGMPLDTALETAQQIAEALEAAHQQGIVHRDLKPANVMIDGRDHVKVLDFGLAKNIRPAAGSAPSSAAGAADAVLHVSDSDATNLTAAGAVLGTAPYMSPEQVRSQELDARSDNWAFGCVLFEMLSGKRAFDRGSIGDTFVAVLEHEPDWDALPSATPHGVRSLLVRCLEKKPRRRVHHIADARIEIDALLLSQSGASTPGLAVPRRRPRWVAAAAAAASLAVVITVLAFNIGGMRDLTFGTLVVGAASGPGGIEIEGLVVLPVRNVSGDPAREHVANGMTDGLISRLQSIGDLRVISRTSSMAYKTDAPPLPEIGRVLRVDRAVEASVAEAPGTVTLEIRLFDVETEAQLLFESFTRPSSEMLTLYDEAAAAIAVALGLAAPDQSEGRPTDARSFDTQAIDLYLEGLDIYARRDPSTFYQALELFRRALERESEFAPAMAAVGGIYVNLGAYFTIPPRDAAEQARDYLRRAIDVDPRSADAHMHRGGAKQLEWDWQGALDDLKQATILAPGSSAAHRLYGDMLVHTGRFEEGFEELDLAIDLDPLDLQAQRQLGECLQVAGRFEDAVIVLNQIIDEDETFLMGHLFISMAYFGLGRADDAVTAGKRAVELSGGRSAFALWALSIARGAADQEQELSAVMADLEKMKDTTFVDPSFFALVEFRLGNTDRGFEYLDEAVAVGSTMMKHLNSLVAAYPEVSTDPRYRRIMDTVGLAHMIPAPGR